MARLAAARAAASEAISLIDVTIAHFVSPDEDPEGAERAEAIEAADDLLGQAASSVQLAQEEWSQVDPREGEPDDDDDDDDDDEDDEDDEDDDE